MSTFFWEIGCEEIPAGMLPKAVESLKTQMESALVEMGLFKTHKTQITSHGTPRRLMVSVLDMPAQQADSQEERRGPPLSRAFDADGKATKAAEGFARSCSVSLDDLQRLETPKGVYLAFTLHKPGASANSLLPTIMKGIITGFPWKKSMRWGGGELRFVRPINWIVALIDGEVLPFKTVDGLSSGNQTYGHRFMAPGPFVVKDVDHYETILRQSNVILDLNERKTMILQKVEELAQSVGGKALIPEDLLTENASLTEWPQTLIGKFDAHYLKIPSEVLITSMKYHQKYFPVVDDQNRDQLLPHFIVVANLETKDQSVLVKGYERVLRARLEDAAFYWGEDRKISLEERLPRLKNVVFQAKLGTLYQKAQRMGNLAEFLSKQLNLSFSTGLAQKAATVCKCDLISGMVGEFPELQGIMGGYYWSESGGDRDTALAIRQHYRPQGMADDLPETSLATVVSLADKLDTLVGCFSVGLLPSGAKDPFALRRAALGVIRMVLNGSGLSLSLKETLQFAYEQYDSNVLEREIEESVADLLDFFYGRLKNLLKAEGYDYDLIDAVQALDLDDLLDAVTRIRALALFKTQTSYEALVAANKRIANILGKADSDWQGVIVDEKCFNHPAEIQLHESVSECLLTLKTLVKSGSYSDALQHLAALRDPIDRFFEDVLVMDQDVMIRNNRLALLDLVRQAFRQVADVSRLVLVEP